MARSSHARILRLGGRPHRSRRLATFALALATLLLIACSSNNNKSNANNATGATAAASYGSFTINSGQPIIIGVSASLSGGTANLGNFIKNGADLAVSQKGTIMGHPVQINAQDDQCGGPSSVSVANTFISNPNVLGVVGPMCSGGCTPAEQVYARVHMVAISASCTAPAVTQQGFDNILRDVPSDAVQGAGQARFAKDTLKATKAFVIDDQSIYAKGLEQQFVQNFADSSHSVVKQVSIKAGDTDFSSIVTQIQFSGADLICYYGYTPEATLLIQQIRKAGITTNYMSDDGAKDPDAYIAKSQGAAEGTYVTEAETPTSSATATVNKFTSDYHAKFNADPGTYSDTAYDAANILLQAIQSVAKDAGGGKLTIDKKALIDYIHKINYNGVTGTITFNANGDRGGAATVLVSKVQGTQFVDAARVTP